MPVIKQEKVEETNSANNSNHTEQKESVLSDEQQSFDSNLNNQNLDMMNGNHNENHQILSAFNELFEQFVVFKKEKEEFEDKMELERIIQKDRLQILEENLNIIKLKLENSLDTQHHLLSGAEENTTESGQFISNHYNNDSDFDAGNDQSIEFSKGRKSSVYVNGENNNTKEKVNILEQEKSNEDSSLDASKRTLRFNESKDKTQYKVDEKEDEEEEEKTTKKTLTPRKCNENETPTIDEDNEKAKKEILNTMSLGEDEGDDDELMEDSEEISIASLTAKTSTASKLVTPRKSSKSPVKRGPTKELSEDEKEDRFFDNLMRTAERELRPKARVNYKSESDENESDKKKMSTKVSSKKQEEEEESENDEEDGENDEGLSKENFTLTNIVDENLEAKKSLQDMVSLNSDPKDSSDDFQSDNDDNDEEEDAKKEEKPKKEKKKAIIDEKLSPSKLDNEESDTEKKTKPRLKVPNLCLSGSSDEEDKDKKKADKGKLRLKIYISLMRKHPTFK